jgi:hypothetical protein
MLYQTSFGRSALAPYGAVYEPFGPQIGTRRTRRTLLALHDASHHLN